MTQVAITGAGPAGLAAARYLALSGPFCSGQLVESFALPRDWQDEMMRSTRAAARFAPDA